MSIDNLQNNNMMSGTWVNPKNGHKFTVRDCFFQDGNFLVHTTDNQILDYNTIQNYVQCVDAEGHELSDVNIPQSTNIFSTNQTLDTYTDDILSKSNTDADNNNIKQQSNSNIELDIVDRVLKDVPSPNLHFKLEWQVSKNLIDTLTKTLNISEESIVEYCLDKIDTQKVIEQLESSVKNFLHEAQRKSNKTSLNKNSKYKKCQ